MKNYNYLVVIIIFFFPLSSKTDSLEISLHKHISYLSSDKLMGRYPTSMGDSLAREYILKAFNSIGLLAPYSNSYLQGFDYLVNIKASGSFCINKINNKNYLTRGQDFQIFPQSGSGQVESNLVFIGYGFMTDYNNYNLKKNIEGNIVLTYLFPHKDISHNVRELYSKMNWRSIVEQAIILGARALIFVVPDKKYDRMKKIEDRSHFSQRNRQFKIPVIQISRRVFETLFTDIGMDIILLENRLKKLNQPYVKMLPKINMNIKISVKYIYKKAYNIIGFLEGSNSDTTIIIGAHYDHLPPKKTNGVKDTIRNGADDNASGVSLLLELAQNISKYNNLTCDILFICFGAEESGFIGSKYFVNNYDATLHDIKLMINLDMVGRMRDDRLFINHIGKNQRFLNCIKSIDNDSLNIQFDKLNGATDIIPFLKANVPAIWITTGFHDDQHQVTDSIDKINIGGMVKIYKYLINIIKHISESNLKK